MRIVSINLYRNASASIARVHIAVRHKLGILIDRWVLIHEGIDFAVVGRGLRRSSQTLCSIGVGRGACEILRQTRPGSVGCRVR